MDRLILDTGALIALERRSVAPPDVLPDDADVAVSAVTASELLVGVELERPRTELTRGRPLVSSR